MRVGLLILALAMTANGQVKTNPLPTRIFRYVSTHKELIMSDVIVIAAESADAASSAHCENVGSAYTPNPCVETNPILGKYPGEPAQWAYSMSIAAALITTNHLLWHISKPDSVLPHLIWFGTAGLAIGQTLNVKSNVDTAENIQNARNRLTSH